MKRSASLVLALLCAVNLPACSQSNDQQLVLENRHVRRVLVNDGGAWRTTRLARADGTAAIDMSSDEFLVRLLDGAEFTIRDYEAREQPTTEAVGSRRTITIHYAPRKAAAGQGAPEVTVAYWLDDEPYLRKSVRLESPSPFVVDRLETERFRVTQSCAQGGRGEPVFIGPSWFVGLEYPGSETKHDQGLVTLAHFPGQAVQDEKTGPQLIQGRVAVAGVGTKGDPIDLAFSDYLDTIRPPSRIMLHYNSWYDFRNEELTSDALLRTYDAFKQNVLDPFRLKMDVFVPDDGWQEPRSIWAPRASLYPQGLRPLSEELKARGSRLGLWIPFNGFNLDVNWGAEQGYEKSNKGRYYCLVGPKYNAELRKILERHIREGDIGYFKHDFNQLQCSADGHGHLPDDRHGHEANLDAELALLAYERRLQPDIYLNVTSCVWHSPWWLKHADSIWMNAGDTGYNTDFPQLSPREWDMSYRDVHFYTLYQEKSTLVPLSAMMTHGIVHGRYELLGGKEETLREWSDNVVMYYGRGVQLMEWYITPELMKPEWWKVLGHATRWAINNRDLLQNVVMVGGDPRKGEVHGYAHWHQDRGILVLRNPDLQARAIEVPFDKSVRYRGPDGKEFQGRIVYPYVERLSGPFVSGKSIQLTVPACTVLVCEIGRTLASTPEPPKLYASMVGKATVEPHGGGPTQIRVQLPVPDEDLQRGDVYFLLRCRGKVIPAGRIAIGSQEAPVREGRGADWLIRSVDLRPYRGKTVDLTLTMDGAEQPFTLSETTVAVWWVADRPVTVAGDAPSEDLPLPVSQAFRRETAELLKETRLVTERPRRTLQGADLKGLTAAKLRLLVFDSNAEEAYRNKFINLNGQQVSEIPANTGPLSAWQEKIIDLPADSLARLTTRNEIELTNPSGDYFKCTGFALAARLPDGSWIESKPVDQVYSSVVPWAYAEGTPFVDRKSGKITLEFD